MSNRAPATKTERLQPLARGGLAQCTQKANRRAVWNARPALNFHTALRAEVRRTRGDRRAQGCTVYGLAAQIWAPMSTLAKCPQLIVLSTGGPMMFVPTFCLASQGLHGDPVCLLDEFLCYCFKLFQEGGGFLKLCAARNVLQMTGEVTGHGGKLREHAAAFVTSRANNLARLSSRANNLGSRVFLRGMVEPSVCWAIECGMDQTFSLFR